MKSLAVVVFAAGRGTRMKSELPKVLHPVLGLPMIEYPLRVARALKPASLVVVVGPEGADVAKLVSRDGETTVLQRDQRGTGDALRTAWRKLRGFQGTLLVLNGDMPLVTPDGLKRLLTAHRAGRSLLTVGTFETMAPGAYGRVVRDHLGRVTAVVESKDATGAQQGIREVNGGVYALETSERSYLKSLRPSPVSGEYYVTDLIRMIASDGGSVGAVNLGEQELKGVNTRAELAEAGAILRDRILGSWMERGVTFLDPRTTWVHPDTVLGRDTTIYPGVVLEGRCRVGRNCTIFPGSRLRDSRIGDRAVILDGTIIEESEVGRGASVGPMAHVRPGTSIGAEAKVGNFVELKNTSLGKGVKASHLTYLGDARVGAAVNIGAGTITCNYDGTDKNVTVIGAGAFIGSDSQLIAPVRVGRGAYVGAGTTLTRDVPPGALVLTRTGETVVKGWAAKRRRRKIGRRRP